MTQQQQSNPIKPQKVGGKKKSFVPNYAGRPNSKIKSFGLGFGGPAPKASKHMKKVSSKVPSFSKVEKSVNKSKGY